MYKGFLIVDRKNINFETIRKIVVIYKYRLKLLKINIYNYVFLYLSCVELLLANIQLKPCSILVWTKSLRSIIRVRCVLCFSTECSPKHYATYNTLTSTYTAGVLDNTSVAGDLIVTRAGFQVHFLLQKLHSLI